MSEFKGAFLFHAPGGAGLRERVVHEDGLARTSLVPVDGPAAAAAAASELREREGLDLVELYGGLGPVAAAAVWDATGGAVPVGTVGVEDEDLGRERVAIFEQPGADPQRDRWTFEHGGRRLTFVAAPEADAVPAVAAELVAAGATRVELCGGLGALPAAATIAAVGDRAEVVAVAFGFESLPGAAGYRARFEAALAALTDPTT